MMPSKLDILEDKINRLVALVEKLTVAEPVQDQWMDVDGLCSYHPDRPAKSKNSLLQSPSRTSGWT